MRTETYTRYICEVCGEHHHNPDSALECEKLPTRYISGLKAGDRVRIKYHPTPREIGTQGVVGKVAVQRDNYNRSFHEEFADIHFDAQPGIMTVLTEWIERCE